MGLFHCALDCGMSTTVNPWAIPVYTWNADGTAELTPLDSFTQTPLLTYYLCRNYNGQTEPIYHLCNEPYDYGPVTGVDNTASRPGAFVLNQNRPNPFNPNTSIEYRLPHGGNARLEVFNVSGQLVDVLVDGYRSAGTHMAVWNTGKHAAGTYLYRFTYRGFSETKKMTLLK
jgi:hypothetical protein